MRVARLAAGLTAALLLTTACSTTEAPVATDPGAEDTFPTKNVTLIVPYTAGGPTDTVGRAIARYWEEKLGWTVVPENKPGAGAAIGMREMVNSAPDGHTLAITGSNAAVVMDLLLGQVKARGATLILVTHDEELARRSTDRIVWLRDGRLEV